MSEQKHTPGPWDMIGSTVYVLNNQNPPCNRFYATVQGGVGDDGRYINDLEVIANANIMGAAPDLLKALVEIQECLVGCLTGGEIKAKRAGKAIEAAAIAIARAKGQPLNPA